jgi:hypothetical protein
VLFRRQLLTFFRTGRPRRRIAVSTAATILFAASAAAFPPAPYYTLYGTVRDDQGQTLRVEGAVIVFYKSGAEKLRQNLIETADGSRNYELRLRMDMQRAGTVAYTDIANGPGNPFSLSIILHNVAYQPIEVSQPRVIGNGGDRVRLDLTLGIDSDNDGLPDAWEQAQLFAAGFNAGPNGWDLSKLDRDGDFDHDGLSNLFEYIAGTSAPDPTDTLELRMVNRGTSNVHLQFFAIIGKTYSLETSTDLKTWVSIPLYLANPEAPPPEPGDPDAEDAPPPYLPPVAVTAWQSTATGVTSIFAAIPAGPARSHFYRLQVR